MSCHVQIVSLIEFDQNSYQIKQASTVVIDAAAEVLNNHPEIKSVTLVGRALPNESGAQKLSERRANETKKALEKKGIDPQRLIAKGVGTTSLIADPRNPKEAYKNRSVKFEDADIQRLDRQKSPR